MPRHTSARHHGYRGLFGIRGVRGLLAGMLLGRIGESMFQITLVLFVLLTYDSPALAGLAVFVTVAPGTLASPFAGALLDRHGRVRLVVLDYLLSALVIATIALLSLGGDLAPPILLALLTAKSMTAPLSNAGLRTVLPQIVPQNMWDVANAMDSTAYVTAALAGPALAGVLVASLHGEGAMFAGAAVFAAAAGATVRLDVPDAVSAGTSLLRSAREGLGYVILRNPTLRGLAVSIALFNLGFGIVTVAVPVLLLNRFGAHAATVGWCFALLGAGGIVSGLGFGRMGSVGRERTLLIAGIASCMPAYALLAGASAIWMVPLGLTIVGAANGALDIGLFALRQRRTDTEWFGRAFAVSSALNYTGLPVGSLLGGGLAARGAGLAIAAGGCCVAASALAAMVMVPASGAATATNPARVAERPADTAQPHPG